MKPPKGHRCYSPLSKPGKESPNTRAHLFYTKQVRALVSHADSHSGGCGFLDTGLSRVEATGHNLLRGADHYLGK